MSALTYSYPEPYKLPAGFLALMAHAVFFSLLYIGFDWHTQDDRLPGMEVEIVEHLPSHRTEMIKVEPPPLPQVEPVKPIEVPKLAEPAEPPKADIQLAAKKKPPVKLLAPAKPVELAPVQANKTDKVRIDPQVLAAQVAQQAAQAEQARVRAEQAAATGKVVGEYKNRIEAKIRRFIVMPPDVQENMQAEFDVVLIPGGSVLSAKLVKPSGNSAYDDAVDRAISKAEPLPLPPDPSLFNKFRELHLTFKPKE